MTAIAASGASEAFSWLVALGVVAGGWSHPVVGLGDDGARFPSFGRGVERLGRLSSMLPRLPGLFPSGWAVAARGSILAGGSILPGAAIVTRQAPGWWLGILISRIGGARPSSDRS